MGLPTSSQVAPIHISSASVAAAATATAKPRSHPTWPDRDEREGHAEKQERDPRTIGAIQPAVPSVETLGVETLERLHPALRIVRVPEPYLVRRDDELPRPEAALDCSDE